MNDGPAASVDVVVGHALYIAVEFEFDEPGRQHVQRGRWAVLNDHDWAQILSDEFAEAREILDDGFWISSLIR